jgi:GNAT superfamily N-acetyltransferase
MENFLKSRNCNAVLVKNFNEYKKLTGYKVRKLPQNHWIWGIRDQHTNELVSIIYLYYAEKFAFEKNVVQWNYTFTKKTHRRKGLSTMLRKASIEWGKNVGWNSVVSVPFEGAYSSPLLVKMGFKHIKTKDVDYYHINI